MRLPELPRINRNSIKIASLIVILSVSSIAYKASGEAPLPVAVCENQNMQSFGPNIVTASLNIVSSGGVYTATTTLKTPDMDIVSASIEAEGVEFSSESLSPANGEVTSGLVEWTGDADSYSGSGIVNVNGNSTEVTAFYSFNTIFGNTTIPNSMAVSCSLLSTAEPTATEIAAVPTVTSTATTLPTSEAYPEPVGATATPTQIVITPGRGDSNSGYEIYIPVLARLQ